MGVIKNSAVRGVRTTQADSEKNQAGRRFFSYQEQERYRARKKKRKKTPRTQWHRDWIIPANARIGFGL